MLLRIKVSPNKRNDCLLRTQEGLVVHIKGIPKEGGANRYLESYLAKRFGLAKSLVRVVGGFTSPYKSVLIDAPEEKVLIMLGKIEVVPQPKLF